MTTLKFKRGNSTYALDSNGRAKLTAEDGTTKDGSWSAISSKENNELIIDIEGSKKSFPVVYSFDRSGDNYNALKVVVQKDDDGPAASAIFEGTIELDDEKDVSYRLPDGGSFVVYGTLSFVGAYDTIQVTFKNDSGSTMIECSKPKIDPGGGDPGTPRRSTHLIATTYSQVGKDGSRYMAKIGVFGDIVPNDNGIVFLGSADGKNFDITIAGTSKLLNGALQISSSEGKLTFAGAVRYVFDENRGSWGVTFGGSDKKFALSADLDFKDSAKDGRTKLSGKTKLSHDGGTGHWEVSFELEGQFLIGKDRALQFSLKTGFVNGKRSIYFSGKVEVKDGTITAYIDYEGRQLKVGLAYETDKATGVIEFLRSGKDVGLRFYVQYAIGGGRQGASPPRKLAV